MNSKKLLSENRLLNARPANSELYVHGIPSWIVVFLRFMFACAGFATAYFSIRSWFQMPLPAQALATFLVPAFLAISIWTKLWKRTTKFLGDKSGLYFPNNSLLVLDIRGSESDEWLHVPWAKITNLRVAREAGDDNAACLAFDVEVTPQERERFFKHVGTPQDMPYPGYSSSAVYVAYADFPPSPEKTLAILKALSAG